MARGGPRPHDEEPLVRIAARRAVGRIRRDAETPQFGRLMAYQATGAAGERNQCVALAGSLFFSVPAADARGRVALYLLLTVCLLYTSPSPRDRQKSRMPSSA